MQPHLVIQKFDEFHHLEQKIASNWERFQSGKSLTDNLRSIVLSSCKQQGKNLHLQQVAPILYQGHALKERKEQNRLLMYA